MAIITLSILACICIILVAGRIILAIQYANKVKQLFSQSESYRAKIYKNEQLIGMPEPVQRYFKLVLTNNQPYFSYARIRHGGWFKTGIDKPWVNIQGEQYATTVRPGFVWKGVTSFFTARDMYVSDEGRLVVSLFGSINIVDAKGATFNQGELLRWLGESVMYPTNLLPSDRLKWLPIDAYSAKLVFNYMGFTLFFIASINDGGEITQMETDRFMDEKHLEKWLIKIAGYKSINGVTVPTEFEVLWRLQKGDFSYAKFDIKTIEYDNPKIF